MSVQEIASKVIDPANAWETRRQFPVGKAQEMVLKALGISANNNGHAEAIFTALGICVIAKRQGRTSIPMVARLETVGGGWNAGGDGDEYKISYPDVDLTPLAQWMMK